MRTVLAVAVGLVLGACDYKITPPAQILRLDPDLVAASGAASVTVDVINEGGGLLRWQATLSHPANPWLTVAPDTGTAVEASGPFETALCRAAVKATTP